MIPLPSTQLRARQQSKLRRQLDNANRAAALEQKYLDFTRPRPNCPDRAELLNEILHLAQDAQEALWELLRDAD